MSRLDAPDNNEAAQIIEAVQLLTDLNRPTDIIATQLHLSEDEIDFIARHGHLPARQLTLAWVDIEDNKQTSAPCVPSREDV